MMIDRDLLVMHRTITDKNGRRFPVSTSVSKRGLIRLRNLGAPINQKWGFMLSAPRIVRERGKEARCAS